MDQQKKRLPWWCVASAVVIVIVALVLGFIETVGRQGTLIGRSASIGVGMSRADVLRILGPADEASSGSLFWYDNDFSFRVEFDRDDRVSPHRDIEIDRLLRLIRGHIEPWPFWDRTVWHLRLWAERAWITIHGERR